MDRDITRKLNEWKSSPFRKPLILKGARQVGKTWALRDFGQSQYSNVVYLSLEKITPEIPSEYAQFFETTKDPHRIIENLSLVSGQPIVPDKTLLILDEIQDCPAAIGSLKYFCEEAPQYHVACAGSLLGVDLAREASFPVGKTDFLQQYPMTFSEYLRASDSPHLDVYCKQIEAIEPLPDAFTNPIDAK